MRVAGLAAFLRTFVLKFFGDSLSLLLRPLPEVTEVGGFSLSVENLSSREASTTRDALRGPVRGIDKH